MDKLNGIYLSFFCIFCLPALTLQVNILYPYGAAVGDIALPKEDDGGMLVHIAIDFPFFDQNHRSLFINTNGIISFLENVLEYTPESFPLGDNRRVIAPFWADVDTSEPNEGNIWYRQITNTTQLQDITDEIMRVFAVDFAFSPFVAKWALIVTWSEVTYYDKHAVPLGTPQNTFQAVLVTDGVHSFTIFNYEEIKWTTGASSGGDKHSGLGTTDDAIAAQVGFNAGDNMNYYSVPYSRTNDIVHVTETTNVGRPGSEGRWVFRIDNKEIIAAGCEDKTSSALQIYPEQVSMLGGDVLTISGPCFDQLSDVYCRIDGHVIKASDNFARDAFTVRCPTPIFMKEGSILVELSKDGGNTFNYTGYTVAIGLDRQPPRVTVHEISSGVLQVQINPTNFPDQSSIPESTRIDVFIYSYKEDVKTGEIVLKLEVGIKTNTRLSQTTFLVNKVDLSDVDVAIYRVVESGKVDLTKEERWLNGQRVSRSNEQPIPAMWSLPYNANPQESTLAQEWCEDWAEEESILDIRTDNVAPCPCTLQQARADIGRFEADPWCDMTRRNEGRNCLYRQTAKHCVRARMPSDQGRGQLCCYAKDDNLLILKDVPEGGFVQRNHHGSFIPVVIPGSIPYLSNFHNDRVPWEQCCPHARDKASCDLFRERRPSDDCKVYRTPKAGTVFGDPHFISFDRSNFTFNGLGEFNVASVNNPSMLIQARLAETVQNVRVTGVIAMSMRSRESDVIHVELSERRVIDTWLKRNNVGDWTRLSFVQFPYWDAKGVTIEQKETGSTITILVTFDTGLAVTVTVPENANAMSAIVLVPPNVKDKTVGLLGTWNDDTDDDLQTPAREIISDRDDPYVVHHSFGLKWAVTASQSLFRYDIGTNHTNVNNLAYVPATFLSSSTDSVDLKRVCGDSWACIYDYHKTNNQTTAKGTKDANDNFDETDKGTTPVSTCGYLTPPDHGVKEGIVYINGSSVTLKCNDGYRLTGSDNRKCVSGAWTGNVTACEKEKDDDILLIVIIAGAIGGVLVIALCFLCLLCLCRKKSKKRIRKDQEMGSVNNLAHPSSTSTLVHPTHKTSNGHTRQLDSGAYDKPLPMTPDEEQMANELYTNGRVVEAHRLPNGHGGGRHHGHNDRHHAARSRDIHDHSEDRGSNPSRPHVLPVAATTASTSHHNGQLASSSNHHRKHHNHHQPSSSNHAFRGHHPSSHSQPSSSHKHHKPSSSHNHHQPSSSRSHHQPSSSHNHHPQPSSSRNHQPSSSHNHHQPSSSRNHHQPSTSHDHHHRPSQPNQLPSSHNQPSTSSPLPSGAISPYQTETPDHVKHANLIGPPPRKSPKKRAKENDYDDPIAVRYGKTRIPSQRGSEIPAYREASDSESEDEIARIKAQMRLGELQS